MFLDKAIFLNTGMTEVGLINSYDVIVAGGGPAGCFSATELVKKGYSVCIHEKQKKGYRKVCGDGIAMAGIEILSLMEFPINRIEEAGGYPIQNYYYYVNGELKKKKVVKPAFCLERNKTDRLFQEYAEKDFGIEIKYNSPVTDIVRDTGGFVINGDRAEKVILAAGANADIKLNGRPFITVDPQKPVGIAAVVKGKAADEGFFMFDYRKEYEGTYGWIFTLGGERYNVGLWRKNKYEILRQELLDFLHERREEWLGGEYEFIEPIRGSYMGIGEKTECHEDGIYLVGDIANSSNEYDGEGISRAIIAAKELCRTF